MPLHATARKLANVLIENRIFWIFNSWFGRCRHFKLIQWSWSLSPLDIRCHKSDSLIARWSLVFVVYDFRIWLIGTSLWDMPFYTQNVSFISVYGLCIAWSLWVILDCYWWKGWWKMIFSLLLTWSIWTNAPERMMFFSCRWSCIVLFRHWFWWLRRSLYNVYPFSDEYSLVINALIQLSPNHNATNDRDYPTSVPWTYNCWTDRATSSKLNASPVKLMKMTIHSSSFHS